MNRGEEKVEEQVDDQDLMFEKFVEQQKLQEEEKIKKLNEQRASMK